MNKYGVKITIPDGTPAEQLRMVDNMIEALRTLGKIANEDNDPQLTPLLEAKAKLEAIIKPPRKKKTV